MITEYVSVHLPGNSWGTLFHTGCGFMTAFNKVKLFLVSAARTVGFLIADITCIAVASMTADCFAQVEKLMSFTGLVG